MNQWLHQMLFTLLGQPVTPLKLIYVAVILLLTFGIIILVRRLTRRFIFSKLQLAEFRVKLYQRTVSTILFFIGLTIATESFIPQAELIRHISEILNFRLFTLGDNPISLSALLTLLVFVIIFAIGSRLLRDMVLSRFLNYMRIDAGTQFTFERIVHYLIMVLGVVVAFQSIGVDLSGLAVIFGFLSVGIGFGLQNVTSNFVAGLILLFERPINVGDRVLIGDVEGDVNEIKIRATRIQTVDNISIIVPNSEFVASNVINYSHGDPKIRINVDVGVSYNSDLDLVLRTLKEVALADSEVLKRPEPDVLLRNFGDSSWEMRLRIWIRDPKRHPIVRSKINCAIVREFRKNGIEIPFPQRDINFRNPMPPSQNAIED